MAYTAEQLKTMIDNFAPVVVNADTQHLSAKHMRVLALLVQANAIMSEIYTTQVSPENALHQQQTQEDTSEVAALRREAFELMGCGYDLLSQNPFLPGIPDKRPAQANFYPADITAEEWERTVAGLPEDAREPYRSFYTVVERDLSGKLVARKYSEVYREALTRAAALLEEAAELAEHQGLKLFLQERARAFLTDDYNASEIAWIRLGDDPPPVFPIVGVNETYVDKFADRAAAAEGFLSVVSPAETANLRWCEGLMQEIEDHLPMPDVYKNPHVVPKSGIVIVNLVSTGGRARYGIQAAATCLPNDGKIVSEYGTLRIMFKNVQKAKYERVCLPIGLVVLNDDDIPFLSFQSFHDYIQWHEILHGLGPKVIKFQGESLDVRTVLGGRYSKIEEAKADIGSLWTLKYLMDTGRVDSSRARSIIVTYLASAVRTLRFGLEDAHAVGMAMQVKWLMDSDGIDLANDKFEVDHRNIHRAIEGLFGELLVLEAEGAKSIAADMIQSAQTWFDDRRNPFQSAFKKLGHVPVDIRPSYPLETAG